MTDFQDHVTRALTDRYEIERELGSGGFSMVYRAKDLKHQRWVAVKVLRPELVISLGADRFLREIQIAAGLTHPHILPLHDSGEVDGLLYYIMPYVEGESLGDLLRSGGPLPFGKAVDIARQVATALDYAHRRAIVHRDIKPENILMQDGVAVVADFGIALAVSAAQNERLTETGLAIGTVDYMSPEQAAGESEVDGRSDLYSLGCVLYEMLTGEPPFVGMSAQAVMAQHVVCEAPELTARHGEVPRELRQVLRRVLSKQRDDRFATGGELADALGSLGSGGAVSASLAAHRPARSIVVLPFVNMSPDPANEFFADGITEELIHGLAKLNDLNVVARTSAFAFKGKHEDVRTIGEQLDVDVVVEGSVRRAGNRLRITAQLINVADGFELWSERYDREVADVFDIEDEISRSIIGHLRLKLLEDERLLFGSTRSFAAYELYLKGRFYWNKRTESGLTRSISYLQQAIDEDPDFALSLAGLADSYATFGIYGVLPPNEAMPQAKSAAERALMLDAGNAQALAALGCVKSVYDWEWALAEGEFKRAIEIMPGYPTAHHWYAINHLAPLGRFDEARRELQRARELDPLSSAINASLGFLSYLERDNDRALTEYDGVLDVDPDFGLVHYFRGLALEQKTLFDEAIAALEKAVVVTERSSETLGALAHILAVAGNKPDARKVMAELEERAKKRYVSPALLGQIGVGLGDLDMAFAWLDKALEGRAAELVWLAVRPTFDAVRSDARFDGLLHKVGLIKQGAAA